MGQIPTTKLMREGSGGYIIVNTEDVERLKAEGWREEKAPLLCDGEPSDPSLAVDVKPAKRGKKSA